MIKKERSKIRELTCSELEIISGAGSSCMPDGSKVIKGVTGGALVGLIKGPIGALAGAIAGGIGALVNDAVDIKMCLSSSNNSSGEDTVQSLTSKGTISGNDYPAPTTTKNGQFIISDPFLDDTDFLKMTS